MKPIVIIYNPTAGQGRAGERASGLVRFRHS